MRNAFVDELLTLARRHSNIALVVGDLGFGVVEPFAEEFPDRFFNAGVAEQNMTGLAAGMASEGMHVFTYSIANFPTFRCAEQVRNDVAYHGLPVTVVSVGGGLSYGALGYSHHAVQDYALMRTMPGMLIAAPGDPMEVRSCLRYLVQNPCPSYLRLGKTGEPTFHAGPPEVAPGRWVPVARASGAQRAVVSTGAALSFAMALDEQSGEGRADVYSVPLWGMESKREQHVSLRRYPEVLTVEDHLQDGGFGSWMLEARSLSTDLECVVRTTALDPVVCGTVGSQSTLNRLGGLSLG